MMNRVRYPVFLLPLLLAARLAAGEPASVPALRDVLAAPTDLWGDAAMRLPEGPSYDFFGGLLPLLRYVNAEFRHYPIVLSAPFSPVKARLVSNGGAVNAHARHASWRDAGVAAWFRIGTHEAVFGEDLSRLDGPRYAEGWLSIVQTIGYVTWLLEQDDPDRALVTFYGKLA